MANAMTTTLGPNDQETLTHTVAENTDSILVTLKSSEHENIITIPTWTITTDEGTEEQFPDNKQPLDNYPAQLQPLGDTLELKIRNTTEHETTVTVGFREKKLTTPGHK